MEIYRKDSEYVVRIDLPGVNPNDVQVHTERNLPTITRERKTEEQAHDYPETCYGNFERTLTLPQGVEADEIVPRYQHRVLEIPGAAFGQACRTEDPDPDRATDQ